MGWVWAARLRGARGFEKVVAIKTVLPSLANCQDLESMLLSEARIASRIRHPNVVETLDVGEQDGILYMVMEWVEGESLSTMLRAAWRRSGFPLGVGLRIVSDALRGLHAAQELRDDEGSLVGLVHRDVSPQNILVSYDGVTKVADFGVAKAAGLTAETAAGEMKGKLSYMSPEQLRGEPLDRRTDIFAMGCVLYQVLTGEHPFASSRVEANQLAILTERAPPLEALRAEYPAELKGLVSKALERSPAARFASSLEMAEALEDILAKRLGRCSTEAVAKYLRELSGTRREDRARALRNAARAAEEMEKDLAPGPAPNGVVGSSEDRGIAKQPEVKVAAVLQSEETPAPLLGQVAEPGMQPSEERAPDSERSAPGSSVWVPEAANEDSEILRRATSTRRNRFKVGAALLALVFLGTLLSLLVRSGTRPSETDRALASSATVTSAIEPPVQPSTTRAEAVDQPAAVQDAAPQPPAASGARPATAAPKQAKPPQKNPPTTSTWTPEFKDPGF